MQLATSGLGDGNALYLVVVANDDVSARAAAYVKLETVTTEAQGEVESGEGILRRRLRGACAAMPEEEGVTVHCA
ncbi:hypothetical protein SBA7_120012 [Candidatus Sulfotelmatobacter sp. SbA7]|nr:hypothetical protein SBA7_120012 [Candidatus Sulfotelmatobacter sp. SbA7]